MAIWFSDEMTPLPVRLLGNGNLSVWMEGATLFSFRAGYSAPHLCSMSPDFGGTYHEVETLTGSASNCLKHRLFYSDSILEMPNRLLCDLQITDLIPDGMNAFLRRMEGFSSLSFRMSIPSYVRTVFHPSYRFIRQRADTLFLTIPAGTAFDNGQATVRERTVALVLCGSLRYDSLDHSIRFGGDLGELYFLSYDDPKELIRAADRLIEAFLQYGELPDLHPIYGAILTGEKNDPVQSVSHSSLCTMQSGSGVVIASQREPYAIATDLPALTEFFLRNHREEDALRMLLRWTAAGEEQEHIPYRLLCDKDSVCPPSETDHSATASYLLATARFCLACAPDGKDGLALYRGMRAAFSSLMQGLRGGMLPFSSRSAAFDAGLLGRELLFHGSAEVTALAIRAGEEFVSYCQRNGKRSDKAEKSYRDILAEARARYESNFMYRGKYRRNAPRLETLCRRPRFIRGVCTLCQRQGAYPMEDALELDKYGRYLCRRCFASRRGTLEETDPVKRLTSARASLMAALLLEIPSALAEVPMIAVSYLHRLHESKAALPLRESDTDPLLLLTLRHRRKELCELMSANETHLAELCKKLQAIGVDCAVTDGADSIIDLLTEGVRTILTDESDDGVLSALLCDTTPMGGRCNAGATALYHLAIES